MIAYLSGILIEKKPTEVILEVQGVGYQVFISTITHEKLSEIGASLTLHTYHHVREDAMQLYGFLSTQERGFFKLLIGISGVGPKLAQTILSGYEIEKLQQAIREQDLKLLSSITGVGKKTAERIVIELKDKFSDIEFNAKESDSASKSSQHDAYSALLSLGFTKQMAEKAISEAIKQAPTAEVDELIKIALRHIKS